MTDENITQMETPKEVTKPYDKLIRATSVGSEQPIFLIATNRWEYFNRYLNDFQDMIGFEINFYILVAVGVILLLMGNALSILSFAGAAYYHIQYQHRHGQVNSVTRRLILGN